MAQEPKKCSKRTLKQQKSIIVARDMAYNQQQNPLREQTNTVYVESPTKVIWRLMKENADLSEKAKGITEKYWNAHQQNLRLERVAGLQKLKLKQARLMQLRCMGL
jgi:DNA-dependent RNA polymerase auxiliary subunit epsilon